MGWQLRHTSNAYNRTCKWTKCDSRLGMPRFWRKKGSYRSSHQGFCIIILTKIMAVSTALVGSSLWIIWTIIFFPIHVPGFHFKGNWDSCGDDTKNGSCTCSAWRGSLSIQR